MPTSEQLPTTTPPPHTARSEAPHLEAAQNLLAEAAQDVEAALYTLSDSPAYSRDPHLWRAVEGALRGLEHVTKALAHVVKRMQDGDGR